MSDSLLRFDSDQAKALASRAPTDRLIEYAVVVDKSYEVNWHHRLVANKLQKAYEAVVRGERCRMILMMPPRHGKSELATIKFPSWVLGKSPAFSVIVCSYSQELATDFGLSTRDTMNTGNYQAIFSTRLRADSQAKANWLTEAGGRYLAVGIGGGITGKGFNIGIIDDPFKNREEADSEIVRNARWKWYRSTFLTREEGNGAVIIIATRWHDDDLVGRILREEGASEWEVVKLQAVAEQDEAYRAQGEPLWGTRFNSDTLTGRKRDIGPYEWSAQYQQDPVDIETQEFKREWFLPRSLAEVQRLHTRRFLTIDPASAMRDKSDYIGAALNFVDRENKWNLISWRLRMDAMELVHFLFKTFEEYRFEKAGIEEGVYREAIQPFLEEEMRKRHRFFPVVELRHSQVEKPLRIRGLVPRYSSNSIFHISGMNTDLEEELLRFPKGINDDVADAAAYQLQVAEAPARTVPQATPPLKPYYPEIGL